MKKNYNSENHTQPDARGEDKSPIKCWDKEEFTFITGRQIREGLQSPKEEVTISQEEHLLSVSFFF